jgi:hypothetical protein
MEVIRKHGSTTLFHGGKAEEAWRDAYLTPTRKLSGDFTLQRGEKQMKKTGFNWFVLGFLLLAGCLFMAGCKESSDEGTVDEKHDVTPPIEEQVEESRYGIAKVDEDGNYVVPGDVLYFNDELVLSDTDSNSISIERDLLSSGYPLTAYPVWDDEKGVILSPEEGGGLLTWEIDWGTEESPKSGLLTIATGEISPDDPNCVAPENLTIIRDSSGVQKLKLLTFFNGSVNNSTHRYVITLKGTLEKGLEDGQDYTGGIIILAGNSKGVDFIF